MGKRHQLLLVVLVVGRAATVDGVSQQPGTKPVVPAVAAKGAIDPVARAAIVSAQRAQDAQPGFVVQSTTLGGNEVRSNQLVYVRPDRYHYTETTGRPDEIIKIGNEGWLRQRGRWAPAPFDFGNVLAFTRSVPAIDAAGYRAIEARVLQAQSSNGATATYEYVVARDQESWRIVMTVTRATNLPAKYEAQYERQGARSPETREFVYDGVPTVDSPSAQVTCEGGAECLEFGERVYRDRNFKAAADFFEKACQGGVWRGCLGYASHLAAEASGASTPSAKTRLADQALVLIAGVIKAEPRAWQAFWLKRAVIVQKPGTDEATYNKASAEYEQAMKRIRADKAPISDWNFLLYPRPEPR